MEAVAYCDQLTLDGSANWRLPSSDEFQNILIDGANVDSTAFPNTPVDYYWSATPVAGQPQYYWAIGNQTSKTPEAKAETRNYSVRCAR